MSLKSRVREVPVLGPTLVKLRRRVLQARFRDSAGYWERRYSSGGNSGAGSYGDVARFKAEFLNQFVATHDIRSVVEFGCGDGAQLSLAEYPSYLGLDVSATAVRMCIERYRSDSSKSFFWYDPDHFHNHGALRADMALSMDVLLHLVEDDVLLRYLEHLSASATRFVVVFTEDSDEPQPAAHVRYRTVESWAHHLRGWEMSDCVRSPVKGPDSQADFYVFTPVESSEGS